MVHCHWHRSTHPEDAVGSTPAAMRIFLVMLSIALSLGCSQTHSDFGPEMRFIAHYEPWGDQLQYKRPHDFSWRDGSGWNDGISRTPPPIAAARNSRPGTPMTCAQEEIIWMIAFSQDEDLGAWASQPDADEIAQAWDSTFEDLVWGRARTDVTEIRSRESFTDPSLMLLTSSIAPVHNFDLSQELLSCV